MLAWKFPGLGMFGELHSNVQTINISYIFKTLRIHLVLFQPCFRIEISISNLRVRIKCFVVKRMRICNTTMAVHGFQNSKKPVLCNYFAWGEVDSN